MFNNLPHRQLAALERRTRLLRLREREGVARGIDGAGALCVEIDGRLETLAAGEVTLRAVA